MLERYLKVSPKLEIKLSTIQKIIFVISPILIYFSLNIETVKAQMVEDIKECKIVKDDKGVIENAVKINGKIYFVFEKEQAKEMLIKLQNYKKLEENVENLSSLNSERKKIIEQKDIQISLLTMSNNQNFKLASNCSTQETPFYKTPEFMFVSGFVLSTGGYYLYQLGDK